MNPHIECSDIGPRAKLIEIKEKTHLEEIFQKINNRKLGDEQIIFYGDNPTKHYHFFDFVKRAQNKKYKIITIVDKGDSFVSPEFTVNSILSGITDIQLIINSLSQSDKKAIINILKLAKVTPPFFKPSLSIGIYNSNKSEQKKMIENLKKLSVKEIFIIDSKKILKLESGKRIDYDEYCKKNRVLAISDLF